MLVWGFDTGLGPDGSLSGTIDKNRANRTETFPAWTLWAEGGARDPAAMIRQRGIFLASGENILELVMELFHLGENGLPPEKPDEDEEMQQCREVLSNRGNSFEIRGNGLSLRNIATREVFPVMAPIKSLAGAGYSEEYYSVSRPLGGIGNYLFLAVEGFVIPCGGRPYEMDGFDVIDISRIRSGQEKMSGIPQKNAWMKHMDQKETRDEVLPSILKQIREYDPGEQTEFETESLYLNYFFPDFSGNQSRLRMNLHYRYWMGCRACPRMDSATMAHRLPAELHHLAELPPVIADIASSLPPSSSIAGFTILQAPAPVIDQLRQKFMNP